MYIMSLLGNLSIVFVTYLDSKLQSPMFFFLGNLSFLDICYISVTVPKMLSDFLEKKKIIYFTGCLIQMLMFISMQGTEAFLLAVMAYDRYIAICSPLCYTAIMNRITCHLLVAVCWTNGLLNSIVHTTLTFSLPFCKSHLLNHYFCDIPPLLKISCRDTYVNELVLFVVGGICVGCTTFLLILISYTFILSAILHLPSKEGKHKAFSTCSSHLIVVALFYGTAMFIYIRPSSSYSLQRDSAVSILYSALAPMLNPIIYSLRNQEIKGEIKKMFKDKVYLISLLK
ncbi:olfactory receptor 5V1-like [Pseudophryne corroboree]|uniref:olfactory receptor 5V1-like n=1 Tax=Pseudophryne corroboree TaxID=495146 RepID=UPI003081A2FF